jgi:hypothetical protein
VIPALTIDSGPDEPSGFGYSRYDREAEVYRWEEALEETAAENEH